MSSGLSDFFRKQSNTTLKILICIFCEGVITIALLGAIEAVDYFQNLKHEHGIIFFENSGLFEIPLTYILNIGEIGSLLVFVYLSIRDLVEIVRTESAVEIESK